MWKLILGSHLSKKVDMLTTYADALSYSLVLSVIPFMVVAFALTGEFVGALNSNIYEHTLESVLPLGSNNAFINHIILAIQTAWKTPGPRTIGLIFAVYTSFSLMNQVVRSLVFIFDDSRRAFEWSVPVFSKTIALLVVWTFLLLAITVTSVLGIFVSQNANFLSGQWRVASDLGLIASLFGAVFATYYLVPSKRPRVRDARNGALIASLGWILCSLLFTNVLPKLFNVNMVYQALGSIVIMLLWAQACAWSLILGACWDDALQVEALGLEEMDRFHRGAPAVQPDVLHG